MSRAIILLAVLLITVNCGIISRVKNAAHNTAAGVFNMTMGLLENGDMTKYLIPEEATASFKSIVKGLGYPFQSHTITTKDGYVNTYFRIQAKGTKIKEGLKPVYLQHGFMDSADAWVINDEDQAIGFILANEGYDVWLGNTRGNQYSNSRIQSTKDKTSYWDFSWQDMALKDVPAAFEYIHKATGQNITYIGHSQGASLLLLALANNEPTVEKYLHKYISLAPVTYLADVRLILRAVTSTRFGYLLPKLGAKEFLVLPMAMRKALATACTYKTDACLALVKLAFDKDTSVDNIDRMGVFFGHFPAGTSVQNFEYWNQLFVEGFNHFDYGKKGNIQHYGVEKAPKVDLSKIRVPVHMFVGTTDVLAPVEATMRAKSEMINSPNVTYKAYPLGHMSFVWAENVMSYFKDVLEELKRD